MAFLKTFAAGENPVIDQMNEKIVEEFGGMVPSILTSMNLRPDLLQTLLQFIKQMMIEDHGSNRLTKEILAAYVSKLNKCAYWLDAHGAMVMAQGQFSQKQMQSIVNDPENSNLIDEKTKGLLRFAKKMTQESYKIISEDIQGLRDFGFSDEIILESIHVIAFFNYLDRMADAIGAPVENIQEMMTSM
jgi:uncharacterized peroxidase-related enzyme